MKTNLLKTIFLGLTFCGLVPSTSSAALINSPIEVNGGIAYYGEYLQGASCEAWGFGAVSIGAGNISGDSTGVLDNQGAFSAGHDNIAFGAFSFAVGNLNKANGIYSAAFGFNTKAESYGQFVIGRFNVTPSGLSRTTWVGGEPLFVIGNGSSDIARSNALTVLKNGAVLIKPSGDLSMGTYTAGTQP